MMPGLELHVLAAFAIIVVLWVIRTDKRTGRAGSLLVNDRMLAGTSIVEATAYGTRRAGLLNHSSLGPGCGLLLRGARSIHTVGMLFAVDVIYLGRDGRVLAWSPDVQPGKRRLAGPRGTSAVLEMAAGSMASLGIVVGDRLLVVPAT